VERTHGFRSFVAAAAADASASRLAARGCRMGWACAKVRRPRERDNGRACFRRRPSATGRRALWGSGAFAIGMVVAACADKPVSPPRIGSGKTALIGSSPTSLSRLAAREGSLRCGYHDEPDIFSERNSRTARQKRTIHASHDEVVTTICGESFTTWRALLATAACTTVVRKSQSGVVEMPLHALRASGHRRLAGP